MYLTRNVNVLPKEKGTEGTIQQLRDEGSRDPELQAQYREADFSLHLLIITKALQIVTTVAEVNFTLEGGRSAFIRRCSQQRNLPKIPRMILAIPVIYGDKLQ